MSNKKIEYEKCVSCGCKTTTPKSLHIDYRNFYIEGSGQLCEECWNKIYKS